jgi:hypothetical protein
MGFVELKTALAGKKTYVAAGILILLGLAAMLDANPNNDFLGISIVMFGLGLAGLGAKADRQHAEMLAHVAKVILDAVQRQPVTADEIVHALSDGQRFAEEFREAVSHSPAATKDGQ